MSIDVNPDDQFHVVHGGNVMALSLDELDTAYQRDLISNETLIWQEGLVEWMRLDTLLAVLESQEGPVAPAPPLPEDVYHVLVAPGEVKQMSLDLLADAYRLDVIDDQTLVWQPGFTEWLPLSLLIGPEPENHVSIASSIPASPSNTSSFAHGTLDDSLAPASYWAPPVRPGASPWWGRSLAVCGLIGAVFAFYRNGVVERLADQSGHRDVLAQWESSVGEPGMDTTHGLKRHLSVLSQTHGLGELAETEPVPKVEPVAKPVDKVADQSEAEKLKKTNEENANEAAEKVDDGAGEKTDKKKGVQANAFGNSLSGKKPVRAAPKKRPASTPKKWRGPTGDPNDPMNGQL